MPGNRDSAGRFVKGESGNPSGRKKADERVQKALKAATYDAAQTLVALLNSNDDRVRYQAATAILDRVYGKPKQSVDVEQSEPINITLGDGIKKYLV